MLRLASTVAFLINARAFDIDCQQSACPETCTCSSTACSDSIATCLNDAECSTVQSCALSCGCGDDDCLLQCAAKTTSPFALPVAECIKSKCPLSSLLKASHVDCGAAACKDVCECSNEKCDAEVEACLNDAECGQVQDCAMNCACGDDDCLLECAGKTSSPLALPVAECIKGKCPAASFLRATTSHVDCSASTCKEACECSNEHCDAEVEKCLGDAECAKVQDCAMSCGCGDDDCLLACAAKTSSPLALPVAECIKGKCSSASFLRATTSHVDCSASTCKAACECSNEHCDAEVEKCLGDAECAKVQDCAMGCGCGDDDCLLACAAKTSSPLALPVAECIKGKCSSASFLRATTSHVDCSASTCKAACECTNEHCDAEVEKCLGDAECAKVQDCAMTCGCGDDDCLLDCAGKTSSPLALPVAECIKGKCSSASFLRASTAQVDCSASSCQEACECTNEHCDVEVQKCLGDAECAKVQTCAMSCGCGDDDCMLACVEQSSSPLAAPVAECVVSKCHVAAAMLTAPHLSCHGAACEESCRCAKQKCIGPGLPCLLDPNCASFQACSFNCACGDADCAMACAQQTPSNKAMPLANCITQRCHSELNI